MKDKRESSEASETASSSSSPRGKGKGKGVACKRRNPRVLVRRNRASVDAIGLPLGMSFAAVLAQVLYRRNAAAESMSPSDLSMMCTSAIKESLASVFGDKLDGLTKNFEQSFGSTLSTLQLIYESSKGNVGNEFNNTKMEIPGSKLTHDKGECSGDIVMEDGHSEHLSHTEIQDQSISREEVRDNFHLDPVSRDITLDRQSNQMVGFSPTSSLFGSNNPMIGTFEKSIVEQCRSNDLKTVELGLTMRRLKLKETALALNFDLNNLERSKLAMGLSKASFKAEKFKTQLEDTRHGELKKKCIDCLIAGLLIMSFSLLYGAYVYSYERIAEATESCTPSTQESTSWWTPKYVISFNSRFHILWCQVQVMSRMVFGVLMILAVVYLLMQRSTTSSSSQTMPVTFILLMLGLVCGYCGKLCIDTLGGSGNVWLLYWEILCLLHFLSVGWTSVLYSILHGPVTESQTSKDNTIFQYWIRRFLFYATLLVFLPLFCGLMPFASIGQWKDHFMLKVSDFNEVDL
ncbi:protein CPR-5 [Abrus precatorius]|uniref:Protein CPR-5 n=1 Tax=Abrus precatorius TaxID=3816 RepID=A0A8B8K4K0_ABRPR|nr:protein CPR-5 [Abrus precatorius]